MHLETLLLEYILEMVKENCPREIALLSAQIPQIKGAIPQLTIKDAKEVLSKYYGKVLSAEDDIDPESERLLSQYAREKLDSEFLFLTLYPVHLRPMYAMPDQEHPQLTRSFDLLFRGMEVTTGGQRIHEFKMLEANIRRFGLDPANFDFYLEAFKFGMPPHGGLAIGAERLTAKLLNLDNIRQATLFPRDINRLTP